MLIELNLYWTQNISFKQHTCLKKSLYNLHTQTQHNTQRCTDVQTRVLVCTHTHVHTQTQILAAAVNMPLNGRMMSLRLDLRRNAYYSCSSGNLYSLQTSVLENTRIFPVDTHGVTKLKIHFIALKLHGLRKYTNTHIVSGWRSAKNTRNVCAHIHSKTHFMLQSLEGDFIWKYNDIEGSTITGKLHRSKGCELLPDPTASGFLYFFCYCYGILGPIYTSSTNPKHLSLYIERERHVKEFLFFLQVPSLRKVSTDDVLLMNHLISN